MGTNPYTAGVFYSGEFIAEEFIQTFSDLGIDRRIAVLAEISARPEVSQLVLGISDPAPPNPGDLVANYDFFHVQANGNVQKSTLPIQFPDKTDAYLNKSQPPVFLIFTDENLDFRYVRSSPTTGWEASPTVPTLPAYLGQFVGEYLEFIADDAQSIYRMTVGADNIIRMTWNRNEPERVYNLLISHGHPHPYDDMNNKRWIDGMIQLGDISTSIDQTDTGFSGVSVPRIGSIKIQLADRSFNFLVSQSWDMRDIEIKVGLTDEPISNYRVIMRGKTERAEATLDSLEITIRDFSLLLDKSIQVNTYTGLGGYTGDEHVAGVVKPLCYGYVRHITPVLVNDALNLYQIHDGPVYARGGAFTYDVYEGGIQHTASTDMADLTLWTPSGGDITAANYRTDNARGCFRLAAKPTAPITYTGFSSTSVLQTSELGQITQAIIQRSVPELTIDTDSFGLFRLRQTQGGGIFINNDRDIRDVLRELIEPISSVLLIDFLGRTKLKWLRAEPPVAFISGNNIVEDSLSRRAPPRPASEYRVAYAKCWTVLNDSDFLLESPGNPSYAPIMRNEYRYKTFKMYGYPNTRLPAFESATAVEFKTLFANPLASEQLAVRLAFRDHCLRNLIEMTVIGFSFQLEVGHTVLVQLDEFDFRNQVKTGIIVEVVEHAPTDSSEDFTDLVIWM